MTDHGVQDCPPRLFRHAKGGRGGRKPRVDQLMDSDRLLEIEKLVRAEISERERRRKLAVQELDRGRGEKSVPSASRRQQSGGSADGRPEIVALVHQRVS